MAWGRNLEQDTIYEETPCDVPATAPVSDEALVRIGTNLRAQYQEVLDEPIPDRICELLRRLDESEDDGTSDPLPDSEEVSR